MAKKTKKKRNKKYNPSAGLRVMYTQTLKDLALVNIVGSGLPVQVFNTRTETDVTKSLTESLAASICLPWKWRYICSILCRKQTGDEYVQSLAVECENAYKQEQPEFLKLLNQHHQKLLAESQRMHVITCAWIAQPIQKTKLTDEQLMSIYRGYGGYEYLSKYESDQQEKEQLAKLAKLVEIDDEQNV